MRLLSSALLVAALWLTGCGYHVANGTGSLPKGISTISVPAFASAVDQYNLGDQMASAIAREFTTRTRYQVIPSQSDADAILNGSIRSVSPIPTVSDPATGRATIVSVLIVMDITLRERATGRTLFSRQNFSVREYYQIADDPHQTFIESGPAFKRVSRNVARDVVASIMDNF